MYQINGPGIWGSVFAVPSEVVDRHIRICGGVSLKVLMILLRHGRPFEAEDLASMLGQSVPDIQDALNYWIDAGIISKDGQAPAALLSYTKTGEEAPPAAAEAQSEGRKITRVGRLRQRMTTRQINEMSGGDPNIGTLLREAQAAFGRVLKPLETETIITLYCYDGMQPDIILMLLQYCMSIGKASMGYIERTAVQWMEKGIDTHESAEQEILRASETNELENTVRKAFGIYGRKITEKELVFFENWQNEMRFTVQMIQLAYERCIESKGKLSFPYINGILSDWQKKGIRNPDEVLRDKEENTARFQAAKKAAPEPKASYDLDQFEQIIKKGNVWDR